MFIRKTATRNKSANESYFTFRLVTSERTGKQVRQITVLNLGRQFESEVAAALVLAAFMVYNTSHPNPRLIGG